MDKIKKEYEKDNMKKVGKKKEGDRLNTEIKIDGKMGKEKHKIKIGKKQGQIKRKTRKKITRK